MPPFAKQASRRSQGDFPRCRATVSGGGEADHHSTNQPFLSRELAHRRPARPCLRAVLLHRSWLSSKARVPRAERCSGRRHRFRKRMRGDDLIGERARTRVQLQERKTFQASQPLGSRLPVAGARLVDHKLARHQSTAIQSIGPPAPRQKLTRLEDEILPRPRREATDHRRLDKGRR